MPAHISEFTTNQSGTSDFVEIRVDEGADVSNLVVVLYDQGGERIQTRSLGSIDGTENGSDVYVLTGGWQMGDTRAFALYDTSTDIVLQFVSSGQSITAINGQASGETSDNVGTHNGSQSLQSDDGGATYYTQTAPNAGSVPCYVPGTMIDTPDGARAVETLRPGDLVNTVDHGPQAIRWVRSGNRPLEAVEDDAKPVLIAAGALGRGLPAKDLIVSPQHRIFVGGGGQLDGWFKAEAFAPAKSLTGLRGIRHMKGKTEITWIHFACTRHEVVTANGCLSESLLLGSMVVNGLTSFELRELAAIYGRAEMPGAALNGPAARDCLKVGEVRRHLVKCKKDKLSRTAAEIRKWDRDLAMEQWEADQLEPATSKRQTRNLRLVS